MNGAEKQIAELLGQIERRDFAVVDDPRIGRLASLVHIAEQYGFRYEQSRHVGKVMQVHMVRDPRPEAAERALATRAAFPSAGQASGTVPGMRPRRLSPLPEAAERVRALGRRIEYDAMDDPELRAKAAIVGVPAVVSALLVLPAGTGPALLVGALMAGFAAAVLGWTAVRKNWLKQRLRETEPEWVAAPK
ncbi:hypothetical protein [Streptomyces nodosus]|uniref:hypothetical protein n=1 Tax=Streptomyces nodosus TaxID=40318 RepID=UPI003825628D